MKTRLLRTALIAFLPVAGIYALATVVDPAGLAAHAQSPNRSPMTLPGLIDALKKSIGVLPNSIIVQTIERRGVTFQVTASAEQQMRRAGATADMVQAARANFRGVVAATPTPEPKTTRTTPTTSTESVDSIYDRASTLYNANRYAEAAPLMLEACDGGRATACKSLGWMYANALGVTKDLSRADTLYQRGCEGGDYQACHNLGYAYWQGAGRNADNVLSVAYFRKACDGEYAGGCTDLGWMYETGRGVTADRDQAIALYRKACNAGDTPGCGELKRLDPSSGGTASTSTASADAAYTQASKFYDANQYTQAAPLMSQACNGGRATACKSLGWMYANGLGVTTDLSRADTLYQRGCDGGDPQACHNLGYAYWQGSGVPADNVRSVALFRKACDAGYAGGCTDLAWMYETGRGVTADRDQAIALYRKGCNAGDGPGCTELKRLQP
jgi:TPR repeat protein